MFTNKLDLNIRPVNVMVIFLVLSLKAGTSLAAPHYDYYYYQNHYYDHFMPFALGDFPTLQSSNWIDDWWNQWNSIGHLQETSTEYTVQYEVDFDPESHPNWRLLPPKDKCGVSYGQRIIGGSEVAMGSIPWIVRIAFQLTADEKKLVFACGGSLISKYYVLTAAHCADKPDEIKSVRLGEHDSLTDPDCEVRGDKRVCALPVQDIKVRKVISHENYTNDNNMKNDVALLRLDAAPVLSQYVQPACLPFGVGMKMNYEQQDTIVAGWGLTEEKKLSNVLLAVTQKVSDAKACRKVYLEDNEVDINYNQGQMCVGGIVGKDSCSGDSGGPLMHTGTLDPNIGARTYVIGVVSQGPVECGHYEIPGVYSRTSYFMKWILDNMEE